eukprot:scaffold2111_cov117-Skeletonema_dohrnii-CCMP3373.AAC.4
MRTTMRAIYTCNTSRVLLRASFSFHPLYSIAQRSLLSPVSLLRSWHEIDAKQKTTQQFDAFIPGKNEEDHEQLICSVGWVRSTSTQYGVVPRYPTAERKE